MLDPSETPWSSDLNAPQIPSWLYVAEKVNFAGEAVGAISYGIVIALFFRCIGVLLSPANPMKRGIKWALIAHTVAMLSFLTIPIGINLSRQPTCYIDYREFPGDDEAPPGPIGWDDILSTKPINTIFNVMFPLNQWLADGLLLHRCYLIYSMNCWAMAFPCLMYLASVGLGIAYIYENNGIRFETVTATNITTSYLAVCLSLNVLLTLMIVVRLIIHMRDIRKTLGSSNGLSGLFTTTATVATMLVESYGIYAAVLIIYIVPWAIGSWIDALFAKVTGPAQVIAPYLVILRVANRRALTSESISGAVGSMHFRNQGSTDDSGSIHDGGLEDAMEVNVGAHSELVTGDKNALEEGPL